MVEQQDGKISTNVAKVTNDNMEIDFADIFYKIISIRRKLYKAAGVGLIIGIVVALSIPKKYTVKVTLSPEMGNSKNTNGLAGLAVSFLGNGSTMGDNPDALNASLSSEIISSTPFLLELLDVKVANSIENDLFLIEYMNQESSPWWNYIIGGPRMIINEVKSFLYTQEKKDTSVVSRGAIQLTYKEASKINFLKKSIAASVDKKSAITQITVTLQDPKVAAILADSVVHKLQDYIVRYRTFKAKEDFIYFEKLFRDRQQEYYIAQKKYANYIDNHDDIIFQSARVEQERLQNDMSLAFQVYNQVANQLQVARAKVQEEKPVFAIVEPAVVPLEPSSIGMKIYVLLFIFLAVMGTIGWNLIGRKFWIWLKREIK